MQRVMTKALQSPSCSWLCSYRRAGGQVRKTVSKPVHVCSISTGARWQSARPCNIGMRRDVWLPCEPSQLQFSAVAAFHRGQAAELTSTSRPSSLRHCSPRSTFRSLASREEPGPTSAAEAQEARKLRTEIKKVVDTHENGDITEHDEIDEEELAEDELKQWMEHREEEAAQDEGRYPVGLAEDFEIEEEEEEEEEEDTLPGDGLEGGGVVLGGALWGPQVLAYAEGILQDPKSQDSQIKLYAFRVYPDRRLVRIRLDKLTDPFGSPSIEELESFLAELHAEVLAAEAREDLPQDIEIEVSTPGAERVVNVPSDLERFSHSPMYVCYMDRSEGGDAVARHEVLDVVEVDFEGEAVVWKMADVRINREIMGKGRRLNKKQRDRRVRTPFKDINVVRIYLDV